MKFQDMPYERVDYEKTEKNFREMTRKVINAGRPEEVWTVHQKYYQTVKDVSDAMTIAHIRHDGDVTDTFYEQEQAYYDEISPKILQLLNEYQRALYESPYRAFMEEKIGKVAFATIENELKSMDRSIIGLMQEENMLATEYNRLMASARIPFEGQELNLSLMRPYLTAQNRSMRRRAWQAYSAYFSSVEEKLDDIFDRLVKNRTHQARALGYDNYVPLGYHRMNRNSYGKDEVENFRRQIREGFVPLAERVHEKRRRRLGVERLSYIDNDVYFQNGNPAPAGNPREILETGRRMYSQMSEETKEFFDFMMDNQLFDVFGRKNKKQGGYMTYLYRYGAPFIFANFNGTSGDVDVITHECGHGFQGYLSGKDPVLEHSQITKDTAEIHSMSMEFFTDPWMKDFFGERGDDFLTMQLEAAVRFVPYGAMVDEFQHTVYEYPQMKPQERKREWSRLERVYMPHLDYEDDPFFSKGGYWQRQPHIYNNPFYYIDYVLAQTCAFQYKVWMNEDYRGAWNSYLKLCRLSAKRFYPDMLKEVGLKVPFDNGYFGGLIQKLENMLE